MAKFAYGGLVLGSSQFLALPQLPQEMTQFKRGQKRLKNNHLALKTLHFFPLSMHIFSFFAIKLGHSKKGNYYNSIIEFLNYYKSKLNSSKC